MAGLVLDQNRTALLIADFYAAMMDTIPHAVDREVVTKTAALQRAARGCGRDGMLLRHGILARLPRKSAPATRLSGNARRRGNRRYSIRWRCSIPPWPRPPARW